MVPMIHSCSLSLSVTKRTNQQSTSPPIRDKELVRVFFLLSDWSATTTCNERGSDRATGRVYLKYVCNVVFAAVSISERERDEVALEIGGGS